MNAQIADFYMAHRQYKEAVPFADAAAGSGAAWGLGCAARAHTRVGDFAKAEELLTEEVEHYGGNSFVLIAWSAQTHHGRRDVALKAFNQHVASRGGNLSAEDALQLAVIQHGEGKVAQAVAELSKRKKMQSPQPLCYLLVFADQAGDAAARKQALDQLSQLKQGDAARLEFAGLLVEGVPDTFIYTRSSCSRCVGSKVQDRIRSP